MLIFAGLAPFTMHGETPGSRSEHVHWLQDVPNQPSIVAPYVNYTNEIKSCHHVRMMVNRALFMSESGSPGPTYLTAAREILAVPAKEAAVAAPLQRVPSMHPCVPTDDALERIGDLLLFAEKPVVVTGYLGRNRFAVESLVALATLIPGLKVIDSEFREMSFPADHPAWTTMTTGGAAAIQSADIILVLDSDVPWIPTHCKPSSTARIFHLDLDVIKKKMQLFDLFAEASFNADCGLALEKITKHIRNHDQFAQRQKTFTQRWRELRVERAMRKCLLDSRARPNADGSISSDHLFATLRRMVPVDTTYVHDAVTNTTKLHEQLQLARPGTLFGKGGSGLGWASGAAIGISLAMSKYKTDERPFLTDRKQSDDAQPLIVSITGDGSFMFGSPCAVHWAQHRLKTPFLTVILNNGGWKATKVAGVSEEVIGYDLTEDAPDYVGIAVAASNGTLWGKRVRDACDLGSALETAVHVVQSERRGALLEVVIS